MRHFLPLLLVLTGCPTDDTECGDGADCDDTSDTDTAPTVPTSITHTSDLAFTGKTIDCDLLEVGVTAPFPVPDCTTLVTATLTQITEGDLCADCDATYEGPLTYPTDTCSTLLGITPPATGAWGFVFTSDTARELWLKNTAGTWTKTADLTGADGAFNHTNTQALNEDLPGCNNGEQNIGDVAVTATFTDQ